MHNFEKFLLWLVFTMGIQFICVALYGVYEAGFGPYQCGFIDAGHYCGIFEYTMNKTFIANLAVGIPTIISGVISLFIVRRVTHTWHI